jgi:toxin ParE1/3/4
MTAQYRVLPAADRDLDDQAAYLATQASLETALRFYDAASSTFANLAGMPGIGERWQSANPRLAALRVWRIAGFEKHLIFYRPADDGIDIVRIIHAARDIDSVLEGEPIQ